jgi:hypothetical protein
VPKSFQVDWPGVSPHQHGSWHPRFSDMALSQKLDSCWGDKVAARVDVTVATLLGGRVAIDAMGADADVEDGSVVATSEGVSIEIPGAQAERIVATIPNSRADV